MRDFTSGLLPELGPGGFEVRPGIVGVGELVEHLALAFSLHLHGQVARVFHAALVGRGENKLRPVGCH